MKSITRYLPALSLFLTALILLLVKGLSSGADGETDSITHYQIARYAFKYPALFLDTWGKPLFTLLSSPFAQFGYSGALMFNLLCGLLTGWVLYLTAKSMGYRQAWAAIIFTIFIPGYIFILYTSLTEILFSLVLATAILFFQQKRYILSAVVISLIPLARTEGLMYIALFIPALVWMKQYRALPFLFAGFLAFSVAGIPLYGDFFWFFTRMPYGSGGSALYGSGSFWFYISHFDYTINNPMLILMVTGLLAMGFSLRTALKSPRESRFVTIYLLILPAFFGFILAQSFLWWKGMMGVLGSDRFMACVLPLGGFMALTGFEWILEKTSRLQWISLIISLYIISLVVYKPFTYGRIPMKTGVNFAVMEQLTDWLKETPYKEKRAFYSDPMFPFYMDMDPYDTRKCFRIYDYRSTDVAALLKAGELLIWDAQFSGFEGHLPFDSLMANNQLRLMNVFTPAESFTILGGEKYKLAVFMKAPRDTVQAEYKTLYFNDFENITDPNLQKNMSSEHPFSGRQSIVLTPEYLYSPGKEGKLKTLPGTGTVSLRCSARVMIQSAADKGNTRLVLSIDNAEHEVIKYITACDADAACTPGEWCTLTLTDVVQSHVPKDGNYKCYVWYQGKDKIRVDDLQLEYKPIGY
jgi:hypothetical protein